jgi:hypothetical protein
MNIFFTIFMVMFVLVVGLILFGFVRGIAVWLGNNRQPIRSDSGRVVSKRTDTSGTVGGNNMGGMVSTSYYATFELLSGERKEFRVGGSEYGQLSEGDEGTLTHQGTRYKGFDRGGSRSTVPGRRASA